MRLEILAAAVLTATAVLAAPPDNADPRFAPWFEGLRQPGTGISCCSIADCRPVDYRVGADGYEVFIEGQWHPIPADKILQGKDNPMGRAVVCWTPARGVLCFVRGTET